MTTLELSH